MTPAEARRLLEEGNRRFCERRPEYAGIRETPQPPFAVVLGCIDARVPPELVFDQGLNDMFVARVAGNVLSDDILGSLELACTAGGCKIVVIMGHTDCAAIRTACAGTASGHVVSLFHKLAPAIQEAGGGATCDPQDAALVRRIAEIHTRRVVAEIRGRSAVLRELQVAGTIAIVGALYDVDTGSVVFAEER